MVAVIDETPIDESDTSPPITPSNTVWLASPLVVLPVLLAFYFLLAGLLGDNGYLGTDSGGKVATLEAVARAGEWSPDLGYWAEQGDPDGSIYPFFGTRKLESGWVNITSIPMVYLAQPLYELGGLRLALLLPMLGSAITALGAGGLARRMGDPTGLLAIWTIGLASPIVVYALDFWEHSIGVALMTGATLLTLDSSSSRHPAAPAFIGGLMFALAASMRQEAFIYGAVAGCFLIFRDRKVLLPNVRAGAGMLGGFVAGYVANGVLEAQLFGEPERAGRAATVLSSGVGRGGALEKIGESILTLGSPINLLHPVPVMLTLVLIAAFVGTVHGLVTDNADVIRRSGAVLGVFALLIVLRMITFGPTFVPGMLAASPLAGIGLGYAMKRPSIVPVVFGLVPLPFVWWFQYPGAAAPQWSGRYVLQSGLVLTVFGLVSLQQAGSRALQVFLAAQLGLAVVGISVVVHRTVSLSAVQAEVAAVDDVVIFSDGFAARELGPAMLDGRWLSASSQAERTEAAELLAIEGIDRFVWAAQSSDPVEFGGFVRSGEPELLDNNWLPLRLIPYEAAGEG